VTRVLLDTNAFLWWTSDPGRLTERARDRITTTDEVLVSHATAWSRISDWAMPGTFFWPSARVGVPGIASTTAPWIVRTKPANARSSAATTSRPVRGRWR
jgi:hypothetical protein